jgi:hypothetical protein
MSKKLEYYGGCGFGYCKPTGVFQVKSAASKMFTNLVEARNYYNKQEGEKAFWDLTAMELIDAYFYSNGDVSSDKDELPF